MTGDELKAAAQRLYGERAWQARLAEKLKVNTSTIRRWVSGTVPIPRSVELAVRALRPSKRRIG